MSTEEFTPEIVAFCCRHCAYSAADLAGGARLSYSPSIKIVELPCTGRASVIEVLHALEDGADGVVVAGCLPGTCHYLNGNTQAAKRVRRVQDLLKDIGLEDTRARMINISAAMGAQFAEKVQEFAETIKEAGPSPIARKVHHSAVLDAPVEPGPRSES
ncbi:MAG: hydrogenase iron-sulfur subunit [Alphaproteobacteria bacterium]|nr:hydrogenase iron-sulfur subunit [Alphaproteobacteria bacterium]